MMNSKLSKVLVVVFLIVSILDVVAVAMHYPVMQAVFKPMIMLSLMAAYYFSVSKINFLYVLAMAFSFLGDVLLMDKNNLFLPGIAAFLCTQLIYIYIIQKRLKKGSLKDLLLAIVPFLLFFSVLLSILLKNLGEFTIPVMVYGMAISIFGMAALLLYLQYRNFSTRLLLLGSILFIVSDSMIALQKFHSPGHFYPVAIMATYVIAQFLIFRYMIAPQEEAKII
jgi:uncharacterized membrane protein YhhN